MQKTFDQGDTRGLIEGCFLRRQAVSGFKRALPGSSGKDDIFGDAGNDLIGGGAGSDNIRGGNGNDYITSSAALNVVQRLKPTDSWGPPADQTVLTQGARWGIYLDTQDAYKTGTSWLFDSTGRMIEVGNPCARWRLDRSNIKNIHLRSIGLGRHKRPRRCMNRASSTLRNGESA